jgi:hypothetical protein
VPHCGAVAMKRKRMAIITSYFGGEAYGLLGPQIAATIIRENTPYDCIVIAVAKEDEKTHTKKTLSDFFGKERPIIGFSYLSGREDLFSLAMELKEEGALTILAGPQADRDFLGERDWRNYLHRFHGLSEHFTFSLHGPAEQAIDLLKNLDGPGWRDTPGLLYLSKDGEVVQNPKKHWDERFLNRVQWDNLYRVNSEGIIPLKIATGQVLQQIGCPYAARKRWVEIDYPPLLAGTQAAKARVPLKGCSFCDVAVDKGFYGELDLETVMSQIRYLPEREDGRKIPFELVNENPLPTLTSLLGEAKLRGIRLSQIRLILRTDWLLKGKDKVREALQMASSMDVEILLASVGFESFDDRILANLNKGVNVETNLKAIRLMRQLKEEFPKEWAYSRGEGAIHGFIHPTPWDSQETSSNIQRVILRNSLSNDILPNHSIPLIIHHACGLGGWMREVEVREGVQFARLGSIIGWWQIGDQFIV